MDYERDQAGQQTDFSYDPLGRLDGVTLPAVPDPEALLPGTPTRPEYHYTTDPYGNTTHIQDPLFATGHHPDDNQRDTISQFDTLGRRIARTLPGSTTSETWTYNELNQLAFSTDFKGQITQYLYDDFGRVSDRRYFVHAAALAADAPQQTVHTDYDALGRMWRVVDTRGTTEYTYDREGRVTRVASPEGTLNYEYLAATGRLARTWTGTNPADPTSDIRYDYDPFGRLWHVTVAAQNSETLTSPEVTTYTYDAAGNLDTVTRPNGVTSDYDFDTQERLSSLTHRRSDGSLLAEYTYGRDDAGRINAIDEDIRQPNGTFETAAVDYVFDDVGRLIHEARDSSVNANDYTVDFVYDLVGNRLRQTKVAGGHTRVIDYTYTAADELSTESATLDTLAEYAAQYDYDANGSLISKIRTGTTGESVVYAYDTRNRLSRAQITRGDTFLDARYAYDDEGIRVRSAETTTVGAATPSTQYTAWLVDHHSPTGYAQTLEERTSTTGVPLTAALPTTSYAYGSMLLSQRLASTGPSDPGRAYFYLGDHLGTTRALTDAAGAVTDTYVYEAFGTLLDAQGSTPNTHGYTGEYFDAVLDLGYHRARYLNSATGLFNARDPFEGVLSRPSNRHKLTYTYGDPVNFADPSGLFFTAVFGLLYGYAQRVAYNAAQLSEGAQIIAGLNALLTAHSAILLSQGIDEDGTPLSYTGYGLAAFSLLLDVGVPGTGDLVATTLPKFLRDGPGGTQKLAALIDALSGEYVSTPAPKASTLAEAFQFADDIVEDSIRVGIQVRDAATNQLTKHVDIVADLKQGGILAREVKTLGSLSRMRETLDAAAAQHLSTAAVHANVRIHEILLEMPSNYAGHEREIAEKIAIWRNDRLSSGDSLAAVYRIAVLDDTGRQLYPTAR